MARSRILADVLHDAAGPCRSVRSFAASPLTRRSVVAASRVRLPLISPQPSITWSLVTIWPLALMTKPVPDPPSLPDFGLAGAFGAAKSPALLMPPALIVLTHLEIAPSNGPAEVRLDCRALLLPAVTTMRLDF